MITLWRNAGLVVCLTGLGLAQFALPFVAAPAFVPVVGLVLCQLGLIGLFTDPPTAAAMRNAARKPRDLLSTAPQR